MSLSEHFQAYLGSCVRATLQRERPFIVAVTGSVGKSSTKQALAALFQQGEYASRTRVTPKNFNNELGLPLTVFQQPAPGRHPGKWLALLGEASLYAAGIKRTGIRTFVLEMGADKPGDLAYLTSLAQPDISVVTAVSPEDPHWASVHAANYPSVEALAEEKATLVRAVRPNGTVILNADDAAVLAMRSLTKASVLTFGKSETADVRILSVRPRMEEEKHGDRPLGIEIKLACLQHQTTVFLPGVFGTSAAYAIAAAFAVGLAMDISTEEMTRSATSYVGLPGRARIIQGVKYTTLLDDSYNAAPTSVLAAIRDMAAIPLQEHQRRIVCVGEMRELGEQAESLHRRVAEEVVRLGIDLFVPCGIFADAMAETAEKAGMDADRIHPFSDAPEAALFIQDWIRPGDLVLAKGSEGPLPGSEKWKTVTGVRMERVIKELMADPAHAEDLLCRQTPAWLS